MSGRIYGTLTDLIRNCGPDPQLHASSTVAFALRKRQVMAAEQESQDGRLQLARAGQLSGTGKEEADLEADVLL